MRPSKLEVRAVCVGALVLSAAPGVARGDIAPVRVTGSMSGQAAVTETGGGASNDSFSQPILVEGMSALADFTDQRIATAVFEVMGVTQASQAWSQHSGGTTVDGGVRGTVFGFGYHDGSTGSQRAALAVTNQDVEFIVSGGPQRYRLHGFVGGLVEPGVPDNEKRRFGRVRLMGPTGLVHEFLGFNTQTGVGGSFDETGFLDPGTYTMDSIAQGRAQTGLSPNADPMITTVQWTLDPMSTCNDIDFNNDGLLPDVADIEDLLNVFAGGACPSGDCDSVDFNNDGLFPDILDIDIFLQVFAGGECA